MSEHLLAMAIGPVQDFIAAARRTRDLWFGSHVLSEISKAAAKSIADQVGFESLIFPAPTSMSELEPDDNVTKLTVANVILAKLPVGKVPADVSKIAQQVAQARWRSFAEKAKAIAGNIRDEVWLDQVDDVVEFFAAWQVLPSEAEYRETRKSVMRLLAGRKACRNFVMAKGRAKLPKSSLDGARETVLLETTKGSGRLPLAPGEQLDVIGLTKRLAGGQPRYPSVARIAADPWLRTLAESDAHQSLFKDFKAVCEKLATRGVLSRSEMPLDTFPYDGTAVFLNRHVDLAKEFGHADDTQTKVDLKTLGDAVRKLTKSPTKGGLGEPNPYLAILVADGDRMGAAISTIETPIEHQRLSRELSKFADEAKTMIRKRNGVCVYAGGDDVLALLPIDECLQCARELSDKFVTLMSEWKTPDGNLPTLSVGLAIGHFMEPLEDLLEFGREAEKAAKKSVEMGGEKERNALAVVVRTRGAAPIAIRDNWLSENDEGALDNRLKKWAELFSNGSLPNKLPYDLRRLAADYEHWPSTSAEEERTLQAVLSKDVKRMLKQKQSELLQTVDGDDSKKLDRQFLRSRVEAIQSVPLLKSLAAELLIAQQISAATPVLQQATRSERTEVVA